MQTISLLGKLRKATKCQAPNLAYNSRATATVYRLVNHNYADMYTVTAKELLDEVLVAKGQSIRQT